MSNFPMRDLAKQIEGMFPNVVMGPVTLDQLTSILTEAYNKGVVDATTVPDDEIAAALREENGRLRAAASVAKEALEATHHVAMYGNADAVREKVSKAINKLDAALTPQVASTKGDEKS